MKLFTLSILLLLSFNLQARVCSEAGASKKLDGTFRGQTKCWEQVYNSDSTIISDGFVAFVNTTSDDGVSVTLASTTAGGVPFCVMNEACAAGKMCECLVEGVKTNVQHDNIVDNSAGHLVFISETSAGQVEAKTRPDIAGQDVSIGTFLDSSDGAGDIEVFIRL